MQIQLVKQKVVDILTQDDMIDMDVVKLAGRQISDKRNQERQSNNHKPR